MHCWQFVRGAYASPAGKAFICLTSTSDKRAERRSRIVLNLTAGHVVTTPRSDVMFVVTEYGMVNLKALALVQRHLVSRFRDSVAIFRARRPDRQA